LLARGPGSRVERRSPSARAEVSPRRRLAARRGRRALPAPGSPDRVERRRPRSPEPEARSVASGSRGGLRLGRARRGRGTAPGGGSGPASFGAPRSLGALRSQVAG